jgi:hypothetical protein
MIEDPVDDFRISDVGYHAERAAIEQASGVVDIKDSEQTRCLGQWCEKPITRSISGGEAQACGSSNAFLRCLARAPRPLLRLASPGF